MSNLLIENELANENICDRCSSEMKLQKHKRKSEWRKHNDMYVCPNCGHSYRRRTFNEVLRDLDLRDDE